MKKNRRNSGIQKDKLFMIAASVFILTAFTVTGVYVADKKKPEQDGYLIDFSELEKNNHTAIEKKAAPKETAKEETKEPVTAKVNSGKVENPKKEIIKNKEENKELVKEEQPEIEKEVAVASKQANEAEKKTYTFSEADQLAFPVAGNVLLNFSMDKAIFYQTMEQYRFNPSVVISAKEDEAITAAADGRVISVFQDAEIGKGVIFDLGNGYELTYAQLKDICVEEGDDIAKGDLIGKVGKPTIYYAEEGSNLYVKLTKDGIPINPFENEE